MENIEKKTPLNDLMDTTMDKIRDMVDSNTIIGEPIQTPDGVTVIPVSRVSFGFGAGGGDYGKTDTAHFGGGAGAGVGIVVGPYPQTRGLGPVDVLQKVRVHVQAAAVAGTDADNGKLLARRRYPAPVDIALIARHVNAVLEKRHKKPPFAV